MSREDDMAYTEMHKVQLGPWADRLDQLTAICQAMQIIGLVLAGIWGLAGHGRLSRALPILTALCGFAGVVTYFLPTLYKSRVRPFAALAGFGIIIVCIVRSL